MNAVPGPVGHPLLGVVPAFVADLLGTLERTFAEHGDLVAYRFGPSWAGRTVYGAFHPDDVARAMTDPAVFGRDTAGFKVIRESIGDGLLTLDGETWKRHRKLVQQLFTHRRVMGYTALMAEEASKVVNDPSLRSGTVDLHDLMQRYTLRVVGRALFGDVIDDIVEELQDLVQQLGETSTARRLQLFTLPLSLPTPRNRTLRDIRRRLFAIADRVLAMPSRPDADDLLTRLRAARDADTGIGLSEQEIRDEVLGFLLAGHETTAGALTFTLHELGRRPDIQSDIAHAADDTLVRATIQEGMRLYPPAHSTERITLVDTTIAGYRVKAGSQILISPWVTHRHPEFWPNPTTFDPTRFLSGPPTHRYAYIPFGGGARACIGMQFALMESTILLKTLLRSYRFDTTSQPLSVRPLLTLRPNGPVLATATANALQPA
ncbi:cytochrome P450 [Saccharothrix variisporea]|uniref:Cytochrome P450 n=1 Tax=Saccharothrix variisporea TaxID=543527 RepID=A0A495X6X0_9PSEU|nr:cytochrome P450 [Saccharothrix variisporea]RKT70171.1 cytochrome P450 [Saccharothrix variisporea]